MAQTVFSGAAFTITHTCEETGPHHTRNNAYYNESLTITALIRGSGSCFVEGTCYSPLPGELILTRADELRCWNMVQEGAHERLSLYFSPDITSICREYRLPLLQLFQNHAPGIGNQCSLLEEDRDGWQVLMDIRRIVAEAQDNADELTQAELHLLILRLLMRLCRIQSSAAADCTQHGSDPATENVCRYIREHLAETLTYQHIQDQCHVSRYQLGEVFHRSTGLTLTEYIIRKRLIQAAQLIRSGEGIERAAASAGFHTYSHFYKEFVRRNGQSPKQYFKNTQHI